jgi:hypothetical protein
MNSDFFLLISVSLCVEFQNEIMRSLIKFLFTNYKYGDLDLEHTAMEAHQIPLPEDYTSYLHREIERSSCHPFDLHANLAAWFAMAEGSLRLQNIVAQWERKQPLFSTFTTRRG